MDEIVYYHLPGEKRFSLDFVNPDRDVVEERRGSYDDSVETKIESYDLDETVYTLYSRSGPTTSVDELEYEFRTAFEGMDGPTRAIVRTVFDVFEGVAEQNVEEENRPLDAYKHVEIEDIPEAIEWVEWDGTVPDVGGQLISNLILRHALPNANHRTAFGMLELYLEAVDPAFSMPSLDTDSHDWQEWVNPFIVDSKRLITVRRNVPAFQYLQEFGCAVVQRKGGIEIQLDAFDLEVSRYEALQEYARQHEGRCTEFVRTLLRRAEAPELLNRQGIEDVEFVDWLERTDRS